MDTVLLDIFAEFTAASETGSAISEADRRAVADIFAAFPLEKTSIQADKPRPRTSAERKQKQRAIAKSRRLDNIAVLDFETDPFDNQSSELILPFSAVLYSDNFEPVIIWEENFEKFKRQVVEAINALSEPYTIYAHNGGKFDFMFLISELRGKVSFKGRGIMSASIGVHELRDSFHIIPEKLANLQKNKFDYSKLKKLERHKWRDEIIAYNLSDCIYLLKFVKAFLNEFGFKISIGQAAMGRLRQSYRFERVGEHTDTRLRHHFFGGRVECIRGLGNFPDNYEYIDVNSMYPDVMANCQHPVGGEYIWRTGDPGRNTCFIDLTCHSEAALVRRSEQTGETHAPIGRARFKTTIWEYECALKWGLLRDIEIHECIDNVQRTDFSKFVSPLYHERQQVKEKLSLLQEGTEEYNELKKDDIFLKLILNNAYGKFAQNPRNYKENYITSPDERPEIDERGSWGDFPKFECAEYRVWQRPNPEWRFNNVGTGASITGAARAKLLDALQRVERPIYCDTDSIICKSHGNIEIHKTKLGAWDIEKNIRNVIINGKKLYSFEDLKDGKNIIRSKGVGDLTWEQMLAMNDGETMFPIRAKGITLYKNGEQAYMERRIRATAKRMTLDDAPLWHRQETRQSPHADAIRTGRA